MLLTNFPYSEARSFRFSIRALGVCCGTKKLSKQLNYFFFSFLNQSDIENFLSYLTSNRLQIRGSVDLITAPFSQLISVASEFKPKSEQIECWVYCNHTGRTFCFAFAFISAILLNVFFEIRNISKLLNLSFL